MKIDSGWKLIIALLGFGLGFLIPDLWEYIKAFFG